MFGADLSGQYAGFPPKEFHYGGENKVAEAKGKINKKAGQATDHAGLEAEGRFEESRGDLKQAGQRARDAFKK